MKFREGASRVEAPFSFFRASCNHEAPSTRDRDT
jgi:hypothetical protein